MKRHPDSAQHRLNRSRLKQAINARDAFSTILALKKLTDPMIELPGVSTYGLGENGMWQAVESEARKDRSKNYARALAYANKLHKNGTAGSGPTKP